jgi:hypothetical protein
MPIQQSIYKNDITREIGGVIYSNDDRNLMQELIDKDKKDTSKKVVKPNNKTLIMKVLLENK